MCHDTTALHANATPCVEHCEASAFMRPSSQVLESRAVEPVPVRNSRCSGSQFLHLAFGESVMRLHVLTVPFETKQKTQLDWTHSPIHLSLSVSEIIRLNPCLRTLGPEKSNVVHDLQQFASNSMCCRPDFPCTLPAPVTFKISTLAQRKFAVVGCKVGFPISVQLDLVMTAAPVSTSHSCISQTRSTL